MPKVAVLGERDAVLGFKSSGALVFAADTPEEARASLKEVVNGDFAILLVTERVAAALSSELAPLYNRPRPVVTILPDARASQGVGMQLLRKRIERAVGANILFK